VILGRAEGFSVIFFGQVISFEELPISQVFQQEALSRLLVEKGIFK
jgi:hypothetical protein